MKAKFLLLIIAVLGFDFVQKLDAQVATFYGVTSDTNQLLIGDGETLIVTTLHPLELGQYAYTPLGTFSRDCNGITNTVPFGYYTGNSMLPLAFVGPGEVVFQSPVIMTYSKCSSDGFYCVYSTPADTNWSYTISASANEIVNFYRVIGTQGGYPSTLCFLQNPFHALNPNPGDEMAGPLTIRIAWDTLNTPTTNHYAPFFEVFTKTTNTVTVADGLTLKFPPGKNFAELQQSSDLKNWTTRTVVPIDSESASFVRLKAN